jgi:hypothetical protein
LQISQAAQLAVETAQRQPIVTRDDHPKTQLPRAHPECRKPTGQSRARLAGRPTHSGFMPEGRRSAGRHVQISDLDIASLPAQRALKRQERQTGGFRPM